MNIRILLLTTILIASNYLEAPKDPIFPWEEKKQCSAQPDEDDLIDAITTICTRLLTKNPSIELLTSLHTYMHNINSMLRRVDPKHVDRGFPLVYELLKKNLLLIRTKIQLIGANAGARQDFSSDEAKSIISTPLEWFITTSTFTPQANHLIKEFYENIAAKFCTFKEIDIEMAKAWDILDCFVKRLDGIKPAGDDELELLCSGVASLFEPKPRPRSAPQNRRLFGVTTSEALQSPPRPTAIAAASAPTKKPTSRLHREASKAPVTPQAPSLLKVFEDKFSGLAARSLSLGSDEESWDIADGDADAPKGAAAASNPDTPLSHGHDEVYRLLFSHPGRPSRSAEDAPAPSSCTQTPAHLTSNQPSKLPGKGSKENRRFFEPAAHEAPLPFADCELNISGAGYSSDSETDSSIILSDDEEASPKRSLGRPLVMIPGTPLPKKSVDALTKKMPTKQGATGAKENPRTAAPIHAAAAAAPHALTPPAAPRLKPTPGHLKRPLAPTEALEEEGLPYPVTPPPLSLAGELEKRQRGEACAEGHGRARNGSTDSEDDEDQ